MLKRQNCVSDLGDVGLFIIVESLCVGCEDAGLPRELE
jgi:hypothetical protein